MSAQRQPDRITEQEFWKIVEASPVKLEFIGGQIVEWDSMAGSTPNHARITANIIIAVGVSLRGQPCYVTTSDQMVRCEATGDDAFPDVVVVCPPERYAPENPLILLNPSVLFEVLSPSTAQKDLTSKSDFYFRIPSLQSYVLVSQDQIRVEHRVRTTSRWEATIYSDLTAQIPLPELGISLSVAEIYEDLSLPNLSLVPRSL